MNAVFDVFRGQLEGAMQFYDMLLIMLLLTLLSPIQTIIIRLLIVQRRLRQSSRFHRFSTPAIALMMMRVMFMCLLCARTSMLIPLNVQLFDLISRQEVGFGFVEEFLHGCLEMGGGERGCRSCHFRFRCRCRCRWWWLLLAVNGHDWDGESCQLMGGWRERWGRLIDWNVGHDERLSVANRPLNF